MDAAAKAAEKAAAKAANVQKRAEEREKAKQTQLYQMAALLRLVGTDINNAMAASTHCEPCTLLPEDSKKYWSESFAKHQADLIRSRTDIEIAKSKFEAKQVLAIPPEETVQACLGNAKKFRADFTAYTTVRDVYSTASNKAAGEKRGKTKLPEM